MVDLDLELFENDLINKEYTSLSEMIEDIELGYPSDSPVFISHNTKIAYSSTDRYEIYTEYSEHSVLIDTMKYTDLMGNEFIKIVNAYIK